MRSSHIRLYSWPDSTTFCRIKSISLETSFYALFEDIRRRRGITTALIVDRNVLNTRNRMLTSLLSIQCDLAILSDFFILRQKRQELANQHNWIKLKLHVNFSVFKT